MKKNISNLLLLLFTLFAMMSCAENREKGMDENSTTENVNSSKGKIIGKYVYLDRARTLHVDRNCVEFLLSDEKSMTPSGVTTIPSGDITLGLLNFTCPRCIDDAVYDKLKSIAESNTSATEADTMAIENQ